MDSTDLMTVGVEEEFQVVERGTGALVPRSDELVEAAAVVLGHEVTHELNLCQIETGTPVCVDLAGIRRHLEASRAALATAGEPLGLAVAATGSHPFSLWQRQLVNRQVERFRRMEDTYQMVAREQVICGCHVHVGLADRDLAVSTMVNVRRWLAVLLALSANSPYWQGADTGYASYRMQVWQRWPTSGMPPALGSAADYDELVASLQAVEIIEDATHLYWYARPSSRYPTLEFRPCDTCITVDDAVTVAGLVRALAWTCSRVDDGPLPAHGLELLDAGIWRAARYGIGERLLSPGTLTLRPASVVVQELLDFVRPGLEAHGDVGEITEGVTRILADGNGADRQRRARAQRGESRDVVELVTARRREIAPLV